MCPTTGNIELVNNVMKSVNDEITSELGEYLVSMSSQDKLFRNRLL